jgi:hypothetical protein
MVPGTERTVNSDDITNCLFGSFDEAVKYGRNYQNHKLNIVTAEVPDHVLVEEVTQGVNGGSSCGRSLFVKIIEVATIEVKK